jgi:hypothetical protein
MRFVAASSRHVHEPGSHSLALLLRVGNPDDGLQEGVWVVHSVADEPFDHVRRDRVQRRGRFCAKVYRIVSITYGPVKSD